MPEGMELSWTAFPDHLPVGYEFPPRYGLKPLRTPIKDALKDKIHGWTATEELINDILDSIAPYVELKEEQE